MARKYENSNGGSKSKKSVIADVIILGCSLPGIVTAHKLKRKFGNTMDIVILDLVGPLKSSSKCNVAFLEEFDDDTSELEEESTVRQVADNVAQHYITMYSKYFNIPLPDAILIPESTKSNLSKLFQHENGSTVACFSNYHDFDYLNIMERFELNQYQTLIDQAVIDVFQTIKADTEGDRKRLLYYDKTTMEKHICDSLLFSTSREIMRNIVGLVCGAPADNISVLFYLHQCFRTSSTRNHLDGDNTRFRDKLLGYCRKQLASKLQQSIADITMATKSIKGIRTYSDEQVILETIKGETNYVCNLLAMALRPDQLHKIQFEERLLSKEQASITQRMIPGRAKKFLIQYEENIWKSQGYSGDILSIQGPIIWAMERPKLSTTGSTEKYAAIIGYLMIKDSDDDAKETVVAQLVKLFGVQAANPVSYKETNIDDVFIPRCGDYVALRKFTGETPLRFLEWGALDIFADGDVAAALEAGHAAYLHLLRCLRPQAQTFEDVSSGEWRTIMRHSPFDQWLAEINYKSSIRFVVYTAAICIGVHLIRSYMKR
ncbi:putative flavin-containing monoamine oxidase A [Aphomia sociella]